MKKIITLAFLAFTISIYAQPVITSGVMGVVGETITLNGYDATDFDPGEDGISINWNFPVLDLNGIDNAYTLVDASGTPYASDFTGANIAFDEGSDNYVYFLLNSTEFSNYGVGNPSVTMYYSDPEKLMSFPIDYLSEHSDDFYSEFTSGVDFIRSGTTTMECDGWGSITLPSGTYNDVVRVKVTEDYQDESDLLPEPITYFFVNYYWLKQGVKGPLLQYSVAATTILGTTTTAYYGYVNANITVGIDQQKPEEILSVMPNPANGPFTIQATGMNHLQIINSAGIPVDQIELDHANEFVYSNELPAGIYFVNINTDSGNVTTKLVIQ